MNTADLNSGGFGTGWGHTRSWSNGAGCGWRVPWGEVRGTRQPGPDVIALRPGCA